MSANDKSNVQQYKENYAKALAGKATEPKTIPKEVPVANTMSSIDYSLNYSSNITSNKLLPLSGSLHPKYKIMSMTRMGVVGSTLRFGTSDGELICHYNPETVQETVAAEYFTPMDTAGVRTERYSFRTGKATIWNMTLLFSTWGDDFSARDSRCLTVSQSLDWIKESIRPGKESKWLTWYSSGRDATGQNAMSKGDGPPPVFVNLFPYSKSNPFIAYIQQAQITYLKLNPETGEPIRAEVGVTFLEYVNSYI